MDSDASPYDDLQGFIDLPERAQVIGFSKLWIAPNHPLVPLGQRGRGRAYVLVWSLHKEFMAAVASRAEQFEAPHWSVELASIGERFTWPAWVYSHRSLFLSLSP